LELEYGTLGGRLFFKFRYTTVEGLIDVILENFKKNNPFMGDSDSEFKQKITDFYKKLENYKEGSEKFTLIIDDPLDNSFLQNFYYPAEDQRVVRT